MSVLARWWRRLRARFGRPAPRDAFTLGVYGAPNAGKTSLANRMCLDAAEDAMGAVSEVPHETRNVERRTLVVRGPGASLVLEVMDTPGLASSVSSLELEMLWRLPPEEAERRAKEAAEGILEAIRHLSTVDGMLIVVDGAKDPATQVSATLVAHVRGRGLRHLVVANKMDLPAFDLDAVRKAFPYSPVVPVSALTGQNLDAYYDALLRAFD